MPVVALDAPWGGLNAYDSVSKMPPTDAVAMWNWIPRSGYCESRPGKIPHTDDLGGSVQTLTAWKGATGPVATYQPRVHSDDPLGAYPMAANTGFRLIAGANSTVFDVTNGGAGVVLGSGFANDQWQDEMINNVLVMVNGEDQPQEYDGTTLTPITTWQLWNPQTEAFEPYTTANEFIGCVSFKGRMYYWKDTGTKFWYCQPGGYKNEIFEFDLGSVLQQGGWITAIFTWTIDPGTGPDDMIVFLFNTGEFLVYQGDDPGTTGYWEQVGRFTMPDPLSIRCNVPFGSDVVVITRSGYISLADVMKGDQTGDYPAFSRKIGRAVLDDAIAYSDYFGHEAVQTDSGFLIFNVPEGPTRTHQYIYNPNTGNWGPMNNLNAISWQVFNDATLFGGTDGRVYVLGGNSDNGAPIPLDAIPAFNYWGDPGNQKHITAAQIISTHPSPKQIGIQGISDFNIPTLVNVQDPATPTGASNWNTAEWNTAYWTRTGGVRSGTTKGWQNVATFGFAVSLIVQMKTQSSKIQWRQTGIRMRKAGAQ